MKTIYKNKNELLILSLLRKIGFVMIVALMINPSAFSQYFLEKLEKEEFQDFETFVQEVEEYYKDKDQGRGSGYKQFKRWEYFYSHRLDTDSKIENTTRRTWDEYFKSPLLSSKNLKSTNTSFTANWRPLGPVRHEIFGRGYNGGLGRVNEIYIDPADSNIIYVGTPGGGLWRSLNHGQSWVPLTDGLPHIGVSGVVIDPRSPVDNRTIYIITGDGDGANTSSIGVLKSYDNGNTWNSTGLSWPVTYRVRGYKIRMHPTDYDVLFVATNRGIYKTKNGGLTWKNTLSGAIADIEFKPDDPESMYASGMYGEFFKSLDSGNNWTQNSEGLPVVSRRVEIAITPLNPDYVYLIFGGTIEAGRFIGLFRSEDAGNIFSMRSNTPNILGYSTTGSDGRSQGSYDLAIDVSPVNAEEIFIGGINTWKSLDGGVNWINTSYWREDIAAASDYTHADIHELQFFGNKLYCGSDGGIFVSENFADDWSNLSVGLQISQFYRIGVNKNDPNIVLTGAQDNGSNRWETNKQTLYHWFGADGFECISHPENPQIQYGSYQNGGLIKTTNYGLNVSTIRPNESGNWITPYVMDPNNPETLIAGYRNVWKTRNGGSLWNNISNDQIGTVRCNHISLAPSDTNIIYVSKKNKLYKTSDGGVNWIDLSPNLGAIPYITYMAVNPTNPDVLWLSMSGYTIGKKVYKSVDGGESWNNISGGLPNLSANCIIYQENSPDRVYVAMDVGVYYLDNTVSDWILFNNGLPNVEVFEIEISYADSTLKAGTYGRGLWETDIVMDVIDTNCMEYLSLTEKEFGIKTYRAKIISTSSELQQKANISYIAKSKIKFETGFKASINDSARMLASLKEDPCLISNLNMLKTTPAIYLTGTYAGPMPGLLEQSELSSTELSAGNNKSANLTAFPNPAGSTTTLKFSIMQKQNLQLSIYNINGKLCDNVIHNQSYQKGEYTLTYDTSKLRPGIYYCVINGSFVNENIKLVIF